MLECLKKYSEEDMIEQFNGDMTEENTMAKILEDVDQEQASG